MPVVLAIDPSIKRTGWACGAPGTVPATGYLRFAKVGASDDVIGGEALKWLTARIKEFGVTDIAIEAPFLGGDEGTTSRTLMGLYALNVVLRVGARLKLGKSPLIIAPSTARKALTGKGRFEKGEAKGAVKDACAALGWVGQDDPDDVSDALAIWAAAAMKIDPAFAASFTPLMRAS